MLESRQKKRKKLNEIHVELSDLNKEASSLAKQIQKNFEELM